MPEHKVVVKIIKDSVILFLGLCCTRKTLVGKVYLENVFNYALIMRSLAIHVEKNLVPNTRLSIKGIDFTV